MTQLLEQAIGEVRALPADQQDLIAIVILEELADERRWAEAFARSQDQLSRLADKVRDDIEAGRTHALGMDDLMNSRVTDDFLARFAGLPDTVKAQARKSDPSWKSDPSHPSLHFKRIHNHEAMYSVRVGKGWRALGLRNRDTMHWFWIGSHAEYDRLVD